MNVCLILDVRGENDEAMVLNFDDDRLLDDEASDPFDTGLYGTEFYKNRNNQTIIHYRIEVAFQNTYLIIFRIRGLLSALLFSFFLLHCFDNGKHIF